MMPMAFYQMDKFEQLNEVRVFFLSFKQQVDTVTGFKKYKFQF